MDPVIADKWVENIWSRIGYDKDDPSTWKSEYLHLPRHREIPASDLCPKAWAKAVELCGGDELIHPYHERFYGDAFIINFGSEATEKIKEDDPRAKDAWHIDDDWYRLFLDSAGNALTIILCFSDVYERGGGTWVCEDGIKGVVDCLYQHPEGFDPPFSQIDTVIKSVPECTQFSQVVGKKGDVFLLHSLLPHKAGANFLRYPRIIANPHVTLSNPHNLNRPDGNYTLVEQVILDRLGKGAVPEYLPTRERIHWFPRNSGFKRAYAEAELERMIAAARLRGESAESVDSIWLKKGTKAWDEYEARNGYNLPINPKGNLMEQHAIPKFK